MRLEYRLDDEYQKFPALWNYSNLTISEAVARMSCEYFVKEAETYVVTATATDPDGTTVLYVKKEKLFDGGMNDIYPQIGFEIRELQSQGSLLLEKREVWNHEEVLALLHSDIIYLEKDGRFHEFTLDSREIDEDRRCYVYYGNYSGKTL
ncbi:hypothetical protein [Neobacillus drentensis]|uniref:hypothetical protein n=1 Tax=Neobacillus drentensis TaxID=220684 RepID=UPI002FFFBC00